MHYSKLTPKQREFAIKLVNTLNGGGIKETFSLTWSLSNKSANVQPYNRKYWVDDENESPFTRESKGYLTVLVKADMLTIDASEGNTTKTYTITQELFDAVDNDFGKPDTSFIRHLSPLDDVSNLDQEIKNRCLPILGAGSSEPALWDSAVRVATVILEERMRDIAGITDTSKVGSDLVNTLFSDRGILASKFTIPSERVGHRNLYDGVVGVFRNPSAHRLIDPTPERGGATIVFIDMLLKMLEELR